MLTLTIIDESNIKPESYGFLSKCIQSGRLKLDFISEELEGILSTHHKFTGCDLAELNKAFYEPTSFQILLTLFDMCFEEDERLHGMLKEIELAMGKDIDDPSFGDRPGYTQTRNGYASDNSFRYRHCIDGGGYYYGALDIDGTILVFYSGVRTKMKGLRESPYFVVPVNKAVTNFLYMTNAESIKTITSKISTFIGFVDGALKIMSAATTTQSSNVVSELH